MKFHKLRIAWSIFWGVAAVLLVGMWVQSYRLYVDFNRAGQHWVAWWYGSISVSSRPSADPYFTQYHCEFPCWLSVTTAVAFILIGWIPERFTLRTLLVATTVVAVVLGAVVWSIR